MADERREVIHGDALAWLQAHPRLAGASVVTSLPDVDELGVTLARWREFFVASARACLECAADEGLCVFIQTDNKRAGRWVSKAGLLLQLADELEVPLLFHKIVCRQPPGTRVHGRPGYSHLLGFSRQALDDRDRPTPDVLPDLGELPWSHSIGTRAAETAVEAVARLSPSTERIVVPCCGLGTILAVANMHGFAAIGIERNRKRAEAARSFTLASGQPQRSA